jgi:peroxiredoxin
MKKFAALTIAIALSITFLVGMMAVSETKEKGKEKGKEKAKAPEFTAMDLVGKKEISLKDYEGHVLLIDFWATWCAPCKKEIPGFVELYKKYKDKKFAVIGVSVDEGEDVVKEFIARNKINYPMIMKTAGLVRAYGDAMGEPIQGIPTTFAVNRKGEIVEVHVGFREKSDFEKQILSLLKEPIPTKENSGSKS